MAVGWVLMMRERGKQQPGCYEKKLDDEVNPACRKRSLNTYGPSNSFHY